MIKMTPESFAAARDYIMAHGRPLDQARFSYHFEDGDQAAVIRSLAEFQNDDGGFGHGLEPDLRTPASSAIATSMGLAILREVNAPADEPVVNAAVRYLLAIYEADGQLWPMVPPAVEDAPHAPWWTYDETEANFDGFRVNPRAALLGHLYHFTTGQDAVSAMLDAAGRSLLAYVETIPDEEVGMHDLLALLELVDAENVPAGIWQPIVDKLRQSAPHVVETDPAAWAEYTLQPLQVAPLPESLLAESIERAAVEANLDYEIERQAADGSWDLPWSWDFVDAEAWAQAERDWKGYHAVNHLRTFAAYNRLP